MNNLWKNFAIRPLLRSDFSEALDMLMNNYFPYQPVCNSIGLQADDSLRSAYHSSVIECLNSGTSRVIIHKNSNQWAATSLSQIYNKEEYDKYRNLPLPNKEDGIHFYKFSKILKMMDPENAEIFQNEEARILYMKSIIVKPQFATMGVVRALVEEGEIIAKNLCCSSAIGRLLHIKSQTIAEKMGYKIISSIDLKEIKDDDGKLMIDSRRIHETTCVQLGLKSML